MGYNLTNAPNANEWFHIIHINHYDYYFVQIAIAFTRDDATMYKRVCKNYSWGTWMPFSPGTATAAQVLKGYTFSSAAGSNLTGTYDPGNDYNNGYNAGYSAGKNDGYNSGKNDMLPNTAWLESWTRDTTDSGSWTCNVSGYYVIFVYGMVNAKRNMIPSVSINGTYISNHDASTEANDHRHVWIYQINAGATVSWSWNTNHGTYYWRNGVAVIRIK